MVKKALLTTFVSLNLLFFGVTSVSFAGAIVPSEEAKQGCQGGSLLLQAERPDSASECLLSGRVCEEFPGKLIARQILYQHFSKGVGL